MTRPTSAVPQSIDRGSNELPLENVQDSTAASVGRCLDSVGLWPTVTWLRQ